MGSCLSSQTASPNATAVDAKNGDPEQASEKPKPMIFAIMRNGHEVIRGGMRDLAAAVERGIDLGLAARQWKDLLKWSRLHAAMEEGKGPKGTTPKGFFCILDESCDAAATAAGLYTHHTDIQVLEAAVTEAFDSENPVEIKAALASFIEANEAHLKEEETVMMPLVQKLKEEGHPLKKYMRDEILAVLDESEKQFFIQYAAGILQHHSTAEAPRFRVFAHALWGVATPEEWSIWNEWIQKCVTPDTYATLEAVL